MMNNIDEIKFKEGKRHQAGMTVPEDFFVRFQENLEKEIDKIEPQRLTIEPAAEIGTRKSKHTFRWMSVAACACVLIVAGVFALQLNETAIQPAADAQLALESEADNEIDTDELIVSSFDDLYLYDLYCEMY